MSNKTSKLVREQVISEVSEDLADTEIEKFKGLVEDVDFGDEESFREKLNTLKESYFPKSDAVTSEITETDETIEVQSEETPEKLDESMAHYTSAIRRYNS